MGGELGHDSPFFKHLSTLSLHQTPRVNSQALISIKKCVKNIKKLDLSGCGEAYGGGIDDRGVIVIIKRASHNLEHINFESCKNLTSKTLIALGKYAPNLRTLNISNCPLMKDKGVIFLIKNCDLLSQLNLAGIRNISEETLFAIALNSKKITHLNVTGCDLITVNGLEALVEGFQFVEMAQSYFGFHPLDRMEERKLEFQRFIQETEASKILQKHWRFYLKRREAKDVVMELRLNKSSRLITRNIRIYGTYNQLYKQKEERRKGYEIIKIQSLIRGVVGRKLAEVRKGEILVWKAKGKHAMLIQRVFRGYRARSRDHLMIPAILRLREERWNEIINAAIVRIQAIVRRLIATKRSGAWIQLKARRERDRKSASVILQCMIRGWIARRRRYQKWLEKESIREMRRRAAVRIQQFYRASCGKYSGKMALAEIVMINRRRRKAATTLQAGWWGFKGREIAFKLRLKVKIRHLAATIIQKMYRGSMVMHWRDMRMNVLVAFILDRQYLEHEEMKMRSQLRYQAFLNETGKDSASESDEDQVGADGLADDDWRELWDDDNQCVYWYNPARNEETYEKPIPTNLLEKAMVGRKIRVFWPMEEKWYEAVVLHFNPRKGRHKIEYDDSDHEWLTLEEEGARIEVWCPKEEFEQLPEDQKEDEYDKYFDDEKEEEIEEMEGIWIRYQMFCPPELTHLHAITEERREKEKRKQRLWKQVSQWELITSFKEYVSQEEEEEEDIHNQGEEEGGALRLWVNKQTGAIKPGSEGCEHWEVTSDLLGWPHFLNRVTGQLLNFEKEGEDPRFDPKDETHTLAMKGYLLGEIRYASYFCNDMVQRYDLSNKEEDERKRRIVLREARRTTKTKHLSATLGQARNIFTEDEMSMNEEIQFAISISKRMDDLYSIALIDHAETEAIRQGMLRESMEKRGDKKEEAICTKCGHETKRSLTYCATCGFKQKWSD